MGATPPAPPPSTDRMERDLEVIALASELDLRDAYRCIEPRDRRDPAAVAGGEVGARTVPKATLAVPSLALNRTEV
jgi:hypothetical protein